MPQMFPLNWIFLYFYFLIIFMMFNILSFFMMNPSIKNKMVLKKNINKLNWKW